MLVRLSDLRSDIARHEHEMRSLLAKVDCVDERVQLACGHLDRILGSVFESLDKSLPWRSWSADDLLCESIQITNSVRKLSGSASWLAGGEGCDIYTIDVDVGLDPMLYSFKFFSEKTQKQTLYVGKYNHEWKIGT